MKPHSTLRSHFIYCISLFTLLSIFTACEEESKLSVDPYGILPKSSVVIVEAPSLSELFQNLDENAAGVSLQSIPAWTSWRTEFDQLSAYLRLDSSANPLENKRIYAAYAPSGAGKYAWLYAFPHQTQEAQFRNYLEQLDSVEVRQYSNTAIYHLGGQTDFYACVLGDLVFFSSSTFLVEEGIRQQQGNYSLLQDPLFAKLYQTANKKELANVYVQLSDASPLFQHLFPQGRGSVLRQMGNWAALDLLAENGHLYFNGLLMQQGDNWWLSTFAGQEAASSSLYEVLPASFSQSVSYHPSSVESWQLQLAQFQEGKGHGANLLDFKGHIRNRFKAEAEALLLHWVDNQVGVFEGVTEGARFAFLRYRDEEQLNHALQSLRDSAFVDGHRGVLIGRLKISHPHQAFLGSLFSGFENPYYIQYNHHLIYSADLTHLKSLINDYLDGKTLLEMPEHPALKDLLENNNHINAVVNGRHFAKHALAAAEVQNRSLQDELRNFSFGLVQLQQKEQAAFVQLALLHQPPKVEPVSRQWSYALDAKAIGNPQFVLNHSSRKYEVLIQDEKNQLYLIDRNGQLLWKRQLDGPVLGNFTQLDAFRNNKLQYAFNTAKSVYMIDRLGQDVEHFPLELKSEATAPMAVMDYDNNRKYRLLVPCGKNLLNFSVEGKEVSGWDFKAAKGKLIAKAQHFAVKGKDIILTYDDAGQLYALARNGSRRFSKLQIGEVIPPFYLDAGSSLESSNLYCLTEEGKLLNFSLKGQVDVLERGFEWPIDRFLYFQSGFLYAHESELHHFSEKNPWRAELDGRVEHLPKALIYKGKRYSGVYSASAEKIYLFNASGAPLPGFPIFAQGTFDMGSLAQNGILNVVTSTEDGALICYAIR